MTFEQKRARDELRAATARDDLRAAIADAQADYPPDSGRLMSEDILAAVLSRPELIRDALRMTETVEHGDPEDEDTCYSERTVWRGPWLSEGVTE